MKALVTAVRLALSVLVLGGPSGALADSPPEVPARLSVAEDVSIASGGQGPDRLAARVHQPWRIGDIALVGPTGRAEAEIPGGVLLRLGASTRVRPLAFPHPGAWTARVALEAGRALGELRGPGEALAIETAYGIVEADGPARLTLAILGDGALVIRALEGTLAGRLAGGWLRLEAGQGVVVSAFGQVTTAPPADPDGSPAAPPLASPGSAPPPLAALATLFPLAADALGAAGVWSTVDGLGEVWQPSGDDPGWSPYRSGGWTRWGGGAAWVPDEPWGWLPYHFGTWVQLPSGRWVWQPPRERPARWYPAVTVIPLPGPAAAGVIWAPPPPAFPGTPGVPQPGGSVTYPVVPWLGWGGSLPPPGLGEPGRIVTCGRPAILGCGPSDLFPPAPPPGRPAAPPPPRRGIFVPRPAPRPGAGLLP